MWRHSLGHTAALELARSEASLRLETRGPELLWETSMHGKGYPPSPVLAVFGWEE